MAPADDQERSTPEGRPPEWSTPAPPPTAQPSNGLGPGSIVGGYRIESVAGSGGMGTVFRASQISLGRTVALKVIAPGFAADLAFQDRFRRESQLAASLDHPNVVTVFEAGNDAGRVFVSMRFVDGPNLRQLLDTEGALPPARAVALVAQVAAALDAAHALGLVHRDVKPANVMIESRQGVDHVFLTDFGLVKRVGSDPELTGSVGWVGTVDYVAPEQIRGGVVGAHTDVYALGALLYTALTGAVPFPREDLAAKLYASVNETVPSVRSLRPGLPPGLDAVIATAMAKDPARRYPSAGAMARNADLAAAPPTPDRWLGHPAPLAAAGRTQPHRRRRVVIALASAVVIILAGVGVAVGLTVGGHGQDRKAGGAVSHHHSTSANTAPPSSTSAPGRTQAPSTTRAPSTTPAPAGPARTMSFQLADSSTGPINAQVPDQPIGSAPSSIPGVTLEIFVAKRQEPGAVLVIFALAESASGVKHVGDDPEAVPLGLSANASPVSGGSLLGASVSGVSLLDPAGLKEYLTFMGRPSSDATCLCSLVRPAAYPTGPTTSYLAALLAAPPARVGSVSFVTGLGTIGNVPISR